ncbi:MAG: VOC family protein [Devosia sp.]|nr:VOC family protein [Devosia sp.]
MAQAIPYLAFDGTCAEAMRFYEATLSLGAKLVMMVSGGDSPMAQHIPPEHAHRILHARIAFADGSLLYAGDTPAEMPFDGMKGVTITMNYPTAAEAERVFAALAEGGEVLMPIAPMFYAKRAGMLTDRFGTSWAINGEVTM